MVCYREKMDPEMEFFANLSALDNDTLMEMDKDMQAKSE